MLQIHHTTKGRSIVNFVFYTLGCKVNQYETQAIRELLISRGHTCNSCKKPDGAIINSCTVTAESDRKTRQLLRKVRRENPDALIVLTGCMVQAFPEAVKELTEADIIVGNKDITNTVNLIEQYIENRKKAVHIEPHKSNEPYLTPSITEFSERTRAFMKIEDGCDRFCSYCIIPTARGRVRSRSLESIEREAQSLALSGYREIVLTGINLSAYGKGKDFNICDAVDAVCGIEGIKRVRLGSLEPDHITDEMLKRLSLQEKFCPQFHLSLQSGCDETLKRMNRHYDTAFYLDLITRIKVFFPDASITTDIMVGFAGEDENEFCKSLEFAKKAGFARAHIFAYSIRSGTAAEKLPSQITRAEKEKRAHLMASAIAECEKEFLKSQCGKIYEVLFETYQNGIAEGYTPNYTRVTVKTDSDVSGRILPVKLITADDSFCTGELLT